MPDNLMDNRSVNAPKAVAHACHGVTLTHKHIQFSAAMLRWQTVGVSCYRLIVT
jgi:hypothetical protein